MAFDGSGNYIRIHNWTSDAANSLNINAGEMDAEDNSIAAALSNCVTRDGQGKMGSDFLPAADNTLNLGSSTNRWLSINGVPISNFQIATQASIGAIVNPVTNAEVAAGITSAMLNQNYPAYDVRRYKALGDGVTNDSAAFNLAGSTLQPVFVPDPPVSWLLSSNVTGIFRSLSTPKISGAGTITFQNYHLNEQDNTEAFVALLEAGTAGQVATFGDSTMWGANAVGGLAQVAVPPYQRLQTFVNYFLNNSALTVVNYAISGTNLAQMLAGTDGSGLTFAARIAASAATVVYCNHGVNDAYGSAYSTTAAVYRANLLQFIAIVRTAGKIPVLVTPHPCLSLGSLGGLQRTLNTARFAQTMRQVALQHGVALVDNYLWLQQMMSLDANVNQVNLNAPLAILPDGVHGNPATYLVTGANLADALLGARCDTLTRDKQHIWAARPLANGTSVAVPASAVSRGGATLVTGATGAQLLLILFRVSDIGLDLALKHPIYSNGAGGITVTLDGNAVGAPAGFNEYSSGFGANFIQDCETLLVRGLNPGLHVLALSTAGPGALAVNGLRARASEKPTLLGPSVIDWSERVLLSPKFVIPASSIADVVVMTDIGMGHFADQLEIEWTANMTANSGLCICALCGSTSAPNSVNPVELLTFGLNSSGYATVFEATAPQVFNQTALNTTVQTGASHVYRVQVGTGAVNFYVDDVQLGTVTLTQNLLGGWLGARKHLTTDVLTFTNISRVYHY